MNFPSAANTSESHLGVIHVINGEHYSGAERVQDLLAQRLPEFGFRRQLRLHEAGSV